jgi:hypothetical protein
VQAGSSSGEGGAAFERDGWKSSAGRCKNRAAIRLIVACAISCPHPADEWPPGPGSVCVRCMLEPVQRDHVLPGGEATSLAWSWVPLSVLGGLIDAQALVGVATTVCVLAQVDASLHPRRGVHNRLAGTYLVLR